MRIGIAGTGLIGGSLGMALCKTGRYKVYCWNRRDEVSQAAIKKGAAHASFESIEELARNSDIVVLATPLGSYPFLCRRLSAFMDGKLIITDVGSVKYQPSLQAQKALPVKYKSFFVPAHPIAGKEKGGLENAEASLFKGKKVIICKTSACKKGQKVAAMWKSAGAVTELMSAKKHDEIYAYVSHYVQYLSFQLAGTLNGLGEFSRLMNSPKELWQEIFLHNQANLKKVHGKFRTSLLRRLKHVAEYHGADERAAAAKIVADAYVDMVPANYRKYAGTGYKSFTSLSGSASKGGSVQAAAISRIMSRIYNGIEKAEL